jgi:hypothetical protein
MIGCGLAAVILLGLGGAGGVYAYMHLKRGSLPVEANKLPSQTREIDTRVIPAAREPNERIKKMYLASELGVAFCSGSRDPSSKLESLATWGSKSAKEFFDPANLNNVRGVLECGSQLATSLDDTHFSYVTFDAEDETSKDSTKKQHVKVGHFKMKTMPASEGYTSVSFGTIAGFCQTTVPAYAKSTTSSLTLTPPPSSSAATTAPTTTTCTDKSDAAFVVNDTWFLGSKAALDEFSKGFIVPKATLGSRVAALQDAFNETSNLPQVSLEAEPKTSKEYLEFPCEFAASEMGIHWSSSTTTTGSTTGSTGTPADTGIKSRDDFMQACFPGKADGKLIEEIDGKLRAIAFETDPDYVDSGVLAGNLILVTRDEEAAKDAERAVKELVNDWKSQIELNAPKLIKAGKDQASSIHQHKFVAVSDTYFQALSLMKVTTSGRTVKISFKAAFTKEDQQELKDEDSKANDKRLPVTEILEAIRDKKPIPQASLAKLVGPSWAAYLLLPPIAPPPPSPKVTLTADECKAVQAKLGSVHMSDLPSGGDSTKAYMDQKYAVCSYKPPEVTMVQRSCLATFVTTADYVACVGGDSSDPRTPPEAEFGKLK